MRSISLSDHYLECIYFDLNQNFSLRGLHDLALRFRLAPEEVERKTTIIQNIWTADTLSLFCERDLEELIQKTQSRVFCINGLGTLFFTHYGYNEMARSEREQIGLLGIKPATI